MSDLSNRLMNRAGTDSKGESKASNALATHCASLYVALAGDEDKDISDARDEVAVGKARRSLRVAKTVEAETVAAKLRMKAALAAASDETPKVEAAPAAPKAPSLMARARVRVAKSKSNGNSDGIRLTPEAELALAAQQ